MPIAAVENVPEPAEAEARERVAGRAGERRGEHGGGRADDRAVDQVALEVDARPHPGERFERRVQEVIGAGRQPAVGLQRGGDQPEDRREHDRQHDPGEDVEQEIRDALAPARREAEECCGVSSHVCGCMSRRKTPHQMKTQTSIASITQRRGGGAEAEEVVGERLPDDQRHHQVGVGPRVGAHHHDRDGVLVRRVDDAEQQLDGDQRPDQRQRDVDEAAPRAGAVDLRCLVELVGDRLQPGEEDQHRERQAAPDARDDDRPDRVRAEQPHRAVVRGSPCSRRGSC